MADKDNPHFKQILAYIFFTSLFSFCYIWAVTFYIVPKENQHIVDIVIGFLLGTVVGSGIGYLMGGNPVKAAQVIPAGGINSQSTLPVNSQNEISITTTEIDNKDEVKQRDAVV